MSRVGTTVNDDVSSGEIGARVYRAHRGSVCINRARTLARITILFASGVNIVCRRVLFVGPFAANEFQPQ
jgi:hypothetical protein